MSNRVNHLALDFAKRAATFPEWALADPGDPVTPHGYAWPEERALPIHNKAAAFCSAVTAAMTDNLPRHATQKAASACCAYQIDDAVNAVLAEVLAHDKSATDDAHEPYALEDGEFRALPLGSPQQIKHAADTLVDLYMQQTIEFPTFYKAARRVNQAAENANITTRPGVAEVGPRDRLIDLEKAAATFLRERREAFTRHPDGAALAKQAAEAFDAAVGELEEGDELVVKLAELDVQLGLRPRLSTRVGRVTRPDVLVYSGVSKAAALETLLTNAIINDVFVPVESLRAIPQSKIEYLLDKSAFDNWNAAATGVEFSDFMAALPDTQRKTILQYAVTHA